MPEMSTTLAKTVRLTGVSAFASVAVIGVAPSAASPLLAPVCANGAIIFIAFDPGGEAPADPDSAAHACHGPCLNSRRMAIGRGQSGY